MGDTTVQAGGCSQMLVAASASVTLIVVSLAYLVRGRIIWKRRLPPGPRGWPVVGSLFTLGTLPHRSLHKLSKQYGPLMFLRLGSVSTVVVSNAKMAEAVLKTNDHILASRPDLIAAHKILYNRTSPGFAPYGPYWRNMRKLGSQELFTVHRISQFQAMRQREVLAMLHSILETSQQGKVVIMDEFLANLATNNITQMMVNKSYCSDKSDSTSTEANSFRDMVREIFALEGAFNLADFLPISKALDLQGYNKRLDAVHEKMDTFLDGLLVQHRQQQSSEKEDKSRKNFVDVLLACTISNDITGTEESLPMDNVKAILTEMISAGTDTASTTSEWALAELLKHPSMLRKAQEELDLVVGKNRLVNEADIPELKYIQAVVKETLRLHSPAPLLVPHESLEDCEIAGYHIPAKSRILVNAWTIHRDPLVWERPLEFDPDRFLGTAQPMDVKGKNFELIPFGSGRRICPGLNLGLLMVQYTLAQMLHTIIWTLPEDQKPEELDMSESFGLVCPKAIPLGVLVKARLSRDIIYPAYTS